MDDIYANWSSELRARFKDPQRDSERNWQLVREKWSVGDCVKGEVITKAHFGAWIDVGIGFPCLLEIINVAGMDREDYQADNWCIKGSEVSAYIIGFWNAQFQICVSQNLDELSEMNILTEETTDSEQVDS